VQKRREQREKREREASARQDDPNGGGNNWKLSNLNSWGSKPSPCPEPQQPKKKKPLLSFIKQGQEEQDEELGYQQHATLMDRMRWKLIDVKHNLSPTSNTRCCCCCSCTWCIIALVIIVLLVTVILAISFAWKNKSWLIAL